jgi:hypothetical protein
LFHVERAIWRLSQTSATVSHWVPLSVVVMHRLVETVGVDTLPTILRVWVHAGYSV